MRPRLKNFGTVVIADYWSWRYDNGKPDAWFPSKLEDNVSKFAAMGMPVILLEQMPFLNHFSMECPLIYSNVSFKEECNKIFGPSAQEDVLNINTKLREIAGRYPNVTTWGAGDIMCPGGMCRGYWRNLRIYSDDMHISELGATLLVRDMIEINGGVPYLIRRHFEKHLN